MKTSLSERITIDPEICHGKPCIRGLRYPVETILEWLSSGMSVEDILKDYEDIEQEDILAVLDFASRVVQVKRIEIVGGMNFLVDAHLPRHLALTNFDYLELTRTSLIEHG